MKVGRVFLLSLFVAVAACSLRQRIDTETAIAKALIPDEEEIQLGQQVHQQLQQQNVRYLSDPIVTNYASGVANRIFAVASRDRARVPWHVNVIDDPKTVNAFAVPGGNVYVYTGLLLAADNEAEIAGVLSHEAGHVVARHSARQLVQTYGLQAITALALGKNPGLAAQLAATIAANGALLAHSRSDEDEADEYGAKYTSALGYDPHGLVTFFQKLQAKEGRTSSVMTWLSTHPATPDRIRHINGFIAANNLHGFDLGRERLAPVKQHLQTSAR